MSQVNAQNYGNLTGSQSVPADTVIAGTAKAWVNFNGTGTVAIRDSFNVSSITDNGVGDYNINFAIAMANVNYAAIDRSRANTFDGFVDQAQQTVSTIQYLTFNSAAVATDRNNVSIAVFSNN